MTAERLALFGGSKSLDPASDPSGSKVHAKWPAVGDEERRATARVLDRGVLSGSNAPEAVAFEREFADFVGARYALLTHSGTSALHLALAAAGIKAGDHVIVPAYSFVATPLSVVHAGAIPIFCDVDEATGLVDPDAVAAAITPRTRAIMPVHVHGCAQDMAPILALAEKHRLVVVEDAAQAHGAKSGGRSVGALGVTGAFSLQSSKNLGVGEGGVFVTNDRARAEEANRVRNFGQDVALADREGFDAERPLDGGRPLASGKIGWMYRGCEFAAAFGRAALAKLPERTRLAQENATRLGRALAELPGVLPPEIPAGSTSVHHKFRVRFDAKKAGLDLAPRVLRDVMIRALRAEGLEVVLWQTEALPSHEVFRRREGFGGGFPWSMDRETDFGALYDEGRFPRTRKLLDGSLLLFSQSCPLIAQDAATVDRYAAAFSKVWAQREELAAWARREGIADAGR